jgi:hypothetical protein
MGVIKMNFLKNSYAKAGVALGALALTATSAFADLVEVDPLTPGVAGVTFNPDEIITPILGCIAAVIVSCAAIWLVLVGVRYIKRFMRG